MNKFIKGLIISLFSGLFAVGAIIIFVDPFFHFHGPLKGYPYLVDNQINMNPGLARHMDYDSVLLGSSMTVAFDTDRFYEKMGLKTQKLSYNGAYPKDQSNIMKIVFDSKGSNVKQVFLGIDELNYSADIDTTKYPITEYLYDNNPFNDIKYIFNKQVLLDYCLRPLADRKDASEWNKIYKPWWQPEHYMKALVLMYYEEEEVSERPSPSEEASYLEALDKNMEINILPFIRQHPETKFSVFFPPYSILYWNNAARGNRIDLIMKKYALITEKLLRLDNTEVYYFQDDMDIIMELGNYADYTHYSPEVCSYIVDCMAGRTEPVSMENYQRRLDVFASFVKQYDYKILWEDWYSEDESWKSLYKQIINETE